MPLDSVALERIAVLVLDEWDDSELSQIVGPLGIRGVDGALKNLIFASDGPKPQIVLRDAVNNTIEIVKHAESCLVYDRPLHSHGLTWVELVEWWTEACPTDAGSEPARSLWQRLNQSLDSEPERLLFRTYTKRYAHSGESIPALIPQVYLHYDPYTRSTQGAVSGSLIRQRMDFLLLLPDRVRVVIEVDGRHHYATPDGRADPGRYARMVSEDRQLRLSGYEVYRFGGYEFIEPGIEASLNAFFGELLSSGVS